MTPHISNYAVWSTDGQTVEIATLLKTGFFGLFGGINKELYFYNKERQINTWIFRGTF